MLPMPGAVQVVLETNVELAGRADHHAVRCRDAGVSRQRSAADHRKNGAVR